MFDEHLEARKEGEKDYSPLMLFPGLVFLFVCLTQPELLKAVSSVSALLCIAAIGGLATMRPGTRRDERAE